MKNHNLPQPLFILLLMLACIGGTIAVPAGASAQPACLTDSEISSSVRAALGRDNLVPSNLIRVQTVDGIVMLDGEVNNTLARRRAGELAQSVACVQGVINRISVVPLARTDEEIRWDVMQTLFRNSFLDPQDVDVAVRNGVVTLEGYVDSEPKKKMIEDLVESVNGVTGVNENFIVVRNGARADYEIADEIKARLNFDTSVNSSFIDVQVYRGHVMLLGMVGSAAQRERAFEDAWVAGVRSVDITNLQVSRLLRTLPPAQREFGLPSDWALQRAVENALAQDFRVQPNEITVNVVNGLVSVSGWVDSLAAKMAVTQDISNVIGVSGVNNELEIYPVHASDAEIQYRIQEAFYYDPLLAGAQISASVTDGRAVLTGIAYHQYQIREAVKLAASVGGVREVINKVYLQNY
jgi:osmotically-inducible protein OsmY